MDTLDRGTELLLYISATIVFGFFTIMLVLTYPYNLGANLLKLLMSIVTFFFICLTAIKLERKNKKAKETPKIQNDGSYKNKTKDWRGGLAL